MTPLLSAMKLKLWVPSLIVQYFPQTITESVFMLFTASIFHFVKICIHGPFAKKCDRTHQDMAFLRRTRMCFAPSSEKKRKVEATAFYKE